MEPAGAAGPRAELVYQLAGALGTELRGLAGRFGPGAVARLVPHVVRALELLEAAAEQEGPGPRAPTSPPAEPRAAPPEERLLLGQLKQVTDRQRDQLRAQSRELQRAGQEAEALQEQLQRVLRVNAELRAKLAAVQVQLRAALRRAAEAQGTPAQAAAAAAPGAPEQAGSCPPASAPPGPGQPAGCSREELSQILQERNELKANVFLLQEELDYYRRELLTDQSKRLLSAMKLTVKKQRRKIKAKMLGTPDEPGSSEDDNDDDDDEASWLPPPEVDGASPPPPPESRIRSFFSLWYRGGSEPSVELTQAGDPTCSQRELKVEEKDPPSPPSEPSEGTS